MLQDRQQVRVRRGEQAYSSGVLVLQLRAGINRLTLRMNEGALILHKISFAEYEPLPSYADYRAARPQTVCPQTEHLQTEHLQTERLLILEAEKPYYKNRPAIAIANNPHYTSFPYATTGLDLNTIDGATYKNHMDTVAYFAEIRESGFYTLGIRAAMPGKADSPVFIDIELNGTIPFSEFRAVPLKYHRLMKNHLLAEWPVYLEKGVHEIVLVINGEPYHALSGALREVAEEINTLSVSLQKITGNNQDPNRDWNIVEFLPDMLTDMERWKRVIDTAREEILVLSNGKTTEETNKLAVALKQLRKLMDKPNKVPYRLSVLSMGESSLLHTLTTALLTLTGQSLNIDGIIIADAAAGPETHLPPSRGNFFFGLSESIKKLAASFQDTSPERSPENSIDVWVLRSRQYADALQNLCEERFTPVSGIWVNFSILTDQGKLTLANAAGKQPDAVLGVDQYYVNDLALRGSLADLRSFSGANKTIAGAAPGALIQMIIDDKLYGLPESQVLYLLYYRSDIFDAFGWKPPSTWDETLLMLSALQRNGMGFYHPLASSIAFKDWPATLSFYYQRGARIYAEGAGETLIGSEDGIEAMRFMTNLFTIYGLPLQVGSFYNEFRSARIPMGVSDIAEYIRLSYSAPEIAGRWKIAPVPGMKNSDGEIERWTACPSKAVCIFDASQKKESSWAFLQWWLSQETQTVYTEKLQNTYGPEFLWISGNMEALKNLPVPSGDRAVIAAQINWLRDAPRIPGGYYTEREVSNAFNRIIYDGMEPRSSVDEARILTNREIRRKLEEFGYVDAKGRVIREYRVPDIEEVRAWLRDGKE